MRRSGVPRAAAMGAAACAILVAAYSAAASLIDAKAIALRLGGLEERTREIDASLREEAKALALLGKNLESELGKAIAEEGRSGRAGLRSQAERVEARLSREIERRDELLSDLALKVDRLDRDGSFGDIGAVVKEGRSEGILARDISLARTLEEAERCYAAGRYGDAAARFAAVVEAAPGDSRLRQKRAISLFRANPADSSAYGLIEGELTRESSGDGVEVLETLASISIERQDWAKALEYLDRLIGQSPKDAKVLKEAGDCALYAGNAGRALSYYDRACASDPGDLDAASRRDRLRSGLRAEKAE